MKGGIKLRKFGKIVINEYIKILLKLSTIIMLVAVILTAVGYNGLRFLENQERQRWWNSSYTNSYDEQIGWAKMDKTGDWESQVELLTFLKEHDVPQDWMHEDFWQYNAAYTMVNQRYLAKELRESDLPEEAQAALEKAAALEAAIEKKDWRDYIRVEMEITEASIRDMGGDAEEIENNPEMWAYNYRLEHNILPSEGNWKSRLVTETRNQKMELQQFQNAAPGEQDATRMALTEEAILVNLYRLDNDMEVMTSASEGVTSGGYYRANLSFWDVFTSSALGINIISVLIIIIAGSVISTEFSSGTIKYLLVNPVKRYKIFLAKYISVLTFAFALLLLYYIFNILVTGILFGFGDIGAPHLYVSGGKVLQGSSFLFVAGKYLVASIGMIAMATLAFAVSSVTKSSALSIGLGVFLYLSGYGVAALLSGFGMDFGRYLLFSNLELNVIAEGQSMFYGQTVPFALMVIGAHMAVFLLTAWDGFVRRDIK